MRAFLARSITRPGAEAAMPEGWLAWLAGAAECAGVHDVPVGWKLVAGGQLGGVHLTLPFRVAAEGGEAVTVQSAGYYVDPRWHGPPSAALFLPLARCRARYHCSVGTANRASAAVWKAFRAEEMVESRHEYGSVALGPAVLEEALVRRLPSLRRWGVRPSSNALGSLSGKVARFRARLGSAVRALGWEAVEPCAQLGPAGPGALPTAALLRWRLSAPGPGCQLVSLESGGRHCAAFFVPSLRGHRGQVPALCLAAAWGPAWDADPHGVLTRILSAARPEFPFFTLGFSPVPVSARALLRPRALDASRRWLARSPAQRPPRWGWNGLDEM